MGTDLPYLDEHTLTIAAPHERLTLTGRHHFSRYLLVFDLGDAPDGATRLRATSYAAFPGPHGRVYRTLVIGTRLHVVATTTSCARSVASPGRCSRLGEERVRARD